MAGGLLRLLLRRVLLMGLLVAAMTAPAAVAAALLTVRAWESFGSHTHPAEFLMMTIAVSFMSRLAQCETHSVARSFDTEPTETGAETQPVDNTQRRSGREARMVARF